MQLQNKYAVKEKKPMEKPMGKIVWFELAVADLERAKAFYSELFGWQFSPFTEFSKDYWMIDAGENGISGGLVKKTGSASAAASPVIYFSVEDIPQSLRHAENMGAKVIKEKTIITEDAGYFALLRDLDQNLIAVWSQK